MKLSCLKNCKPGDIIDCDTNKYVVASRWRDGRVHVNYLGGERDGRLDGYFYEGNMCAIQRIIKKKK